MLSSSLFILTFHSRTNVKYDSCLPIWADVWQAPVPPEKTSRRETIKYQDLLCTEAEKGTAEVKGYGSDRMMGRFPSCGTIWNMETREIESCLTLVYGNSANSQPIKLKKYFSILVDPARGYCYRGSTKPCESNVAIHGVLLSNTWTTYP